MIKKKNYLKKPSIISFHLWKKKEAETVVPQKIRQGKGEVWGPQNQSPVLQKANNNRDSRR